MTYHQVEWRAQGGGVSISGRCWAGTVADVLEQVTRALANWELAPPPTGPPLNIEMRVIL